MTKSTWSILAIAGVPSGPEEKSAAGLACVAACSAGYAALCQRVLAICATATAITVGGTTVPCATAAALSCVGGAALSAICSRQCPP